MMTLTIELDVTTQKNLEDRAKRDGVSPSDVALKMLRESFPQRLDATGDLSDDTQWRAFLDDLKSSGFTVPDNLKTSTFDREMIYDDHD